MGFNSWSESEDEEDEDFYEEDEQEDEDGEDEEDEDEIARIERALLEGEEIEIIDDETGESFTVNGEAEDN